MKYPSYPEYRESGVEWLGEVPGHWEVRSLRYQFTNLDHRRIPVSGEDRATVDKVYPYYGASGIIDYVDDYIFDEALILVAEDGANLLSRSTPLAFLATGKYWVNNHAHILHPNTGDNIYWTSVLQSFDYTALITGAAQPKLTSDRLGGVKLPVPPDTEQRAIAVFLDAQTAKIDTLIAKKRDLIDRLKEKRAALITRAVTKGLDPKVKMKDSGVEWLGEVPEHWEVKRFSRHINKIEQGWSPQAETGEIEDGCWGVLKLSAVKAGKFHPEESKSLPEDTIIPRELEVAQGDLLITRANTPELVGDVCVVDFTPPLRMLCDLIYRVTIDKQALFTEYIKFYILSDCGRSQIVMDARGSSGSMVKLAQGHIKGWTILVPPLHEQHAIVAHIDRETANLESLNAKIEAVIERLQEYRSALITAAVTGKIDVRGYSA